MHSRYSDRAVSLLVFLPVLFLPIVLTGQRLEESVVPLKNWAAPLYWQPSQAEMAERETAVELTPKLVFSATQVSPSALTFVAVTPCRLVDTRGVPAGFNGLTPFSGPSLAPSTTVNFPVQSAAEAIADTTPTPCGTIPSIAQAYSFNITAIPKTSGGVAFVTMWPTGSAQPAVSTLNDGEGVILANAAIVPAGTPSGGVSVFNSGPATTDVIIDMNGFYAAPSDLSGNTAVGSGALVMNVATSTSGIFNTAIGVSALRDNMSGVSNTAVGEAALTSNTTGNQNTAIGTIALQDNTMGTWNTATGNAALFQNTTGSFNTATGGGALGANTTGGNNTANGYVALASNTTGSNNTATGVSALANYSTASSNTAVGYQALQGGSVVSANTGDNNTAVGQGVLINNTTGGGNTASGFEALNSNTAGINNTAIGGLALYYNTTGCCNIAIGVNAANLVSGGNSNNIHIGSQGASGDSGVIRIGTQGSQTSFFVTGVNGVTTGSNDAIPVLIDASGQLGTVSSSRRYKEDIQDMGKASRDLMRLRPVTFRYKKPFADGSKPIQYGLIAEEVDEVYPDLVAHSADGQIETVKYQVLDSMLLNEVQKQNQRAQQQDETIRTQQEQVSQQQEQIRKLEARLTALEGLLSGKVSAAATAGR